MKRLPGNREVDRSLVALTRSIERTASQLNQRAAQLMTKGDYSSVEALLEAGKSIQGFHLKVESLRREWSTIQPDVSTAAGTAVETTKLWEYYQPVLRAVAELGGASTRAEIEDHLSETLATVLKQGDFTQMAHGVPRWKVMVRRARRPLIREGFLEDGAGPWRLTAAGLKAAEASE